MSAIKPGDIIIFEAGDSWLSRCIATLTDSNVSHAAMRYTGENMVEMGASGIQLNNCQESSSGDKAYLMRLNPEKDPALLTAAAKHYLDECVQYDFPDLVFFAGLLIFRHVRPTPQWKMITDMILNQACAELDKLLNILIHKKNPSPVMVCSQLVYQCYLDCGDDYKIKLEDELLQSVCMNKIRLADLVNNPAFLSAGDDSDMSPKPYFNLENAAHDLFYAMEESDCFYDTCLLTADELNSTLNRVKRFLDTIEHILECAGIDVEVPALFIAPSDLLYHAVNLKQYDTVYISRK